MSTRFPAEKSSRRPGWTKGLALPMADGKSWHLPAIGDHLIPDLGRLVPTSLQVVGYQAMMERGELQSGDPADQVGGVWLDVLLCDLLSIQYRTRRQTMMRLLGPQVPDDARSRVLLDYLPHLGQFVSRRVPLGLSVSGSIASKN